MISPSFANFHLLFQLEFILLFLLVHSQNHQGIPLTRDEYHQPVHTLPTVDSDIIEMVFIDGQ